jgi:hypothetical protein
LVGRPGNKKTVNASAASSGLRHTSDFDKQYCNKKDITIKRYYNKKTFLLFPCELKIFFLGGKFVYVLKRFDFEIQQQYFYKKISFYIFILISLYCSIAYRNVVCDEGLT